VFDGAYASRENLEQAKALGVERVAFSRGRGLTPEDMAGSLGGHTAVSAGSAQASRRRSPS
jgi:hypothetical protein